MEPDGGERRGSRIAPHERKDARFDPNPSGAPFPSGDPTFGTKGVSVVPVGSGQGGGVAFDARGRIVVMGFWFAPGAPMGKSSNTTVIARFIP